MATKIAVIGTGMGGLGAVHRFGQEKVAATLYDKEDFFGGHTVSWTNQGFTFDMGPHVSFTKDPRIQELFAKAVNGKFEAVQYKLNNYWQGHWVAHPAQTHLYGLPPDVIVKVVEDFVRQSQQPLNEHPKHYGEWLVAQYGRTFSEWFPYRYTRKYHTTDPANLTTDWIGPRMYRPSLQEVLLGSLTTDIPNKHYVTDFRYPSHGGFYGYVKGLARDLSIALKHTVVRIDPKTREIHFANGSATHFDAMVSSIPLPELIPLISGTPADVLAAAKLLACSSCVLVNIGVDRPDLSEVHISYFYDEDLLVSRVNYPHLMSPNTVPPGCSSVQAEVYFSAKYRPFTGKPSDYVEPVIRDLKRCGVLRENENIVFKEGRFVDYANIIFDHDREAALAKVLGYLNDIRVRTCGRYGAWGYYWTDDSFKSGEDAAAQALQDLRRAA